MWPQQQQKKKQISFPFFKLPDIVKQVASKPDGYPMLVIFENVAKKKKKNHTTPIST